MIHNTGSFNFTKLPWNIEAAASAILFYSLGNLFAKHIGAKSIVTFSCSKKLLAAFAFVLCSVLFVGGALWNGHISLGSNLLGKSTVVLYVVGLLGSVSALILSSWLDSAEKSIFTPLAKGLRWIGHNSFYFMAVHVPIKGVIIVILAKVLGKSTGAVSSTMIYSFIAFIPSLIATIIAVIVINMLVSKFKALTSKQPKKSHC